MSAELLHDQDPGTDKAVITLEEEGATAFRDVYGGYNLQYADGTKDYVAPEDSDDSDES